MNSNHLLGKAAGQNDFLILPHIIEEIHSTVTNPNSSAIQDLDKRTTRLETKFDNTDSRVKSLDDKVDGLIKTFTDKLDNLEKKLETETSAERTVTWRPLLWLLGTMITAILMVGGFFYTLLPEKIETGISKSASLDKHFEEVNKSITDLRNELKGLSDSNRISAALKNAVSGDTTSLTERLPEVKKLTDQIITQKVPLQDRDYKEISETLTNHYNSSKPPLQHQIWEAFIQLTNARSSTETIAHPLSEDDLADIEKAKAAGHYFEHIEVDLSHDEEWEDAVFKNCKIKMGNPEKLILTRVRFIECEFQPETENWSSLNLLKTVLQNDGSQISAPIASFWVSKPRGKVSKPLSSPTR